MYGVFVTALVCLAQAGGPGAPATRDATAPDYSSAAIARPVRPAPVGETVVTARKPPPFTQSTQEVRGSELLKRGRRNVAEVLEQEPAIQGRSGSRGERRLQLRGFEQKQVRVTLNGVPLLIPYDGRLDLSKIPAGLLGQVQLIKGPASLEFGPTGMGGAINLTTRDPALAPRFVWDARATEGAAQSAVAMSVRGRTWGVVAAADLAWQRYFRLSRRYDVVDAELEDGGRRTNSDRKSLALGVAANYRPHKRHRLSLVAAGALGAFGIPPRARNPNPRFWRFPEYDFLTVSLSHRVDLKSRIRMGEAVYFALYRNVLQRFDDQSYVYRTPDSDSYRSVYFDASVGGRWSLELDLPRLGKRSPHRTFRMWTEVRHDLHRARDEQGRDPQRNTTFFRLIGEEAIRWKKGHDLRIQADFQGEVPGTVAGETPHAAWHVGPLIGYGYQRRRWEVQAVFARRTRFPTLSERFASAQGSKVPNPDLGPESTWTLRAGVQGRPLSWLKVSVSFFGSFIEDVIDLRPLEVPPGDPPQSQQQNLGLGVITGVELLCTFRFRFGLQGRLGYQYLFARLLEREEGQTDWLTGRTPHQALAQLSYRPWRYLELRTALRLRSPTRVLDSDRGAYVTVPTHVLWDARVTLGPWHGMSVYAEATNLIDGSYETHPGYPEPGIRVWGGLRIVRE